MKDRKAYDGLSGLVFFVGVFEGVVPFVARPFGKSPLLSVPTWLDGPAWWIVSLAVIVVAAVLLIWIDAAKKRRFPE